MIDDSFNNSAKIQYIKFVIILTPAWMLAKNFSIFLNLIFIKTKTKKIIKLS